MKWTTLLVLLALGAALPAQVHHKHAPHMLSPTPAPTPAVTATATPTPGI